jgi:hypothetical protein
MPVAAQAATGCAGSPSTSTVGTGAKVCALGAGSACPLPAPSGIKALHVHELCIAWGSRLSTWPLLQFLLQAAQPEYFS